MVEGVTTDTDCPNGTPSVVSGTLTVTVTNSPPVIISQPQPTNQTVTVGNDASVTVVATGCPSAAYQWRLNATNIIASGTNATLTIFNVQPTNAGNYTVVVTDGSGSVTSSVAVLTVVSAACTNISGLVSWWKGESNGLDSAGVNNGQLEGGVAFALGKVGQAFAFNTSTAAVEVAASPSLNVGTNGGFTVEGWVYPTALDSSHSNQWFFGWKNQAGTVFGVNMKLSQNGPMGDILVDFKSTGGSHLLGSGAVLLNNDFQHVAVTYNQASGVATIYRNGTVVAQQTLGSFTVDTSEEVFLGARANTNALENTYQGLMDEVSLYSRALSAGEIQAIYNASSAGKCMGLMITGPTNVVTCSGSPATFAVTASGCGPLSYTWEFGTSVLAGQTNSTLTISNVNSGNAGTYSVIVSGPCGSQTGSATLTVLTNLTVAGPQDISVCSGSTAVFGVTAFGTGPITYQWYFGTNILAGQTNSSLAVTNVTVANSGTYSVAVSAACGTITNSAVLRTLSIVTQPATQAITYGQTATFSVTAAGYNSPTYQWRLNGVNIPGATANSYTVVQATVAQSGSVYDVVVSSPYCSIVSSAVSLLVNPAPLLVSANNQTKVYGAFPAPYTWTATGFLNGDTAAVMTGAPGLSSSATTNTPVGSYVILITPGTLGAANYSLSFSNGTVTVTRAILVIAADNKSRQYGLTNPPLTWTPSGFSNNETASVLSGAPQLTCAATTNSPVGLYLIQITQGTLTCTNYSFSFSNGTLTVTTAGLTATADNKIKVTGSANPTFTGAVVGVRNNDNITASYSTPATTVTPAGTYPIIPILNDPTGKLPNYSVSILNGTLTITDAPPTIRVDLPSTLTVFAGSTMSLGVVAAGTPPLTYAWYYTPNFGGPSLIPGATGSNYSKVVGATDSGNYWVQVSSASGSVTSAVTAVTVIVPATITTQPSSQIVAQGSNATFSVAASGTPTLLYQWYTNGNAIGSGSKYAGATSSTLTVSNASSADAVTYTVAIMGPGGIQNVTTSVGVNLTVVSVSQIIVDGSNPPIQGSNAVSVGTTTVLRAVPNPAGVAFPSNLPVWVITNPSGSSSTNKGIATYTNANTTVGQYTITASCGTSSANFTLAVFGSGDSNYDGIADNLELGYGTNVPQVQLGSWLFDSADWSGVQGQLPLSYSNLDLVQGWSVGAVEINNANGPAWLAYRESESAAPTANINCRNGSVRFLFEPDWSSGTGPGTEARLIEMGTKGTTNGAWGLYVNSTGTSLYFCTQTNGASVAPITTNLSATISWSSANWYEIVLTYGPTNSALYVNQATSTISGGATTNNTTRGITNWPGLSVRTNGFYIGNGSRGTNCAQGRFDNLQTFNYPLSSMDVTNYHNKHKIPPNVTNSCLAVEPIALNFPQIQNLAIGQIALATNGTGNGNFGWLNWNTALYTGSSLTMLLLQPTLVTNFADADTGSNVLKIGSWLGVFSGGSVGNAGGPISYLQTNNIPCTVVLWDTNKGTGGNKEFRASGFVQIQVISNNLSGGNGYLAFRYLGAQDCQNVPTAPPAVQIVNPTNYQIFSTPASSTATIPVTAIATADTNASITNVSFYYGTNATAVTNFIGAPLFGTVTNGTSVLYTINWTNAPHGTNYLMAIATDNQGTSSNSLVVPVIVNWAPIVSAGPSFTNIWVEGSSTFVTNLLGSVSDDGLPIGKTNLLWSVIASNGLVSFSTLTQAVTTATFNTNGTFTLALTADDTAATNSSQCTVVIQRRPFVSITFPTNNAPVNSSTGVPINATAYDINPGGFIPANGVTILDVSGGTTNVLGTATLSGNNGITNFFGFEWVSSIPLGSNTLLAIATDGLGLTQTSAPVNINVYQGLSVGITPQNPSACPGLQGTFYAVVSGSGPFTYSWSFNGTPLVNQTNSSLFLPIITTNNAGQYSLQVSNQYSTGTAATTLTVRPPTTAVGPTDLTVTNGQTAILSTTASGAGPFTYVWTQYGIPLAGQTNSTLVISNASPANEGLYSVIISGACGNVVNSATLTIAGIFMVLPANNAQELARATVQLTSVTHDNNKVTNVVYQMNGATIGSSGTSPFVVVLPNLPGSTNVFQAIGKDNGGLTLVSPLVTNLVLHQPPTIQIFVPHSNDTFVVGGNVLIGAQTADADGVVTNVVFDFGATQLGSVSSAISNNLFYLTWTPSTASSNVLIAIATDNNGFRATSSVPVIVEQPCVFPGVSNLVLSVGQVLGGETLTGTVVLSNAAPATGEAINITNSSQFVGVPPVVIVPANANAVSFSITTTPDNVTNVAIISAAYHNQNPQVTASLTVTPGPDSSNGGNTNGDPVLISANNAAFGSGPIQTYGFPSGALVNSFIPDSSANENGRAIAVSGNEIYYTEDGSRSLGYIPVAPYGVQASGGSDLRTLPSPDPSQGIAGLSFFNSALYVLVGYGSGNPSPQVYKLDPASGNVLAGPITLSGATNSYGAPVPTSDADGFTVLPNGNFLVNDDDGDNEAGNLPIYREYDRTTGNWVTNGTTIDLTKMGVGLFAGTGVTLDPNGDSLYFVANVTEPQLFIQTDLKGNLINAVQLDDSLIEGISVVRARPDESSGAVIFVRDDLTRTNPPFQISAPHSGGAATRFAQFGAEGYSGSVTGARLLRAGATSAGAGSTFDAELGAAATNGQFSSFGELLPNANSLGASPYCFEWALPDTLLPTIQSQLSTRCSLLLTDSLSGICGTAYSLTDTPEQLWPMEKNILTVAVKAAHVIPQGRVRDFVLTGVSAPLNGSWDIVFRNQIIASSGQPNGWDVEADHTAFGGFIVTAPIGATPDQGYEVRVIQPDWDTGRSSTFGIVQSNSIASAPVLLPLLLSTNMIGTSSTSVSLTVSLDYPAPFGDAYVNLNGPSVVGLPLYVVIPAGQKTVTTNLQINAGSPGPLIIQASYNGYRQAKVLAVGGCFSPAVPTIQSIGTNSLGSVIAINWSPVPGATGYNVLRGVNTPSLSPYFSGLTTTNFVDTAVLPQITYYYGIITLSNLCLSTPALTNFTLPYPIAAPAPLIIPSGGTFNDKVKVTITNLAHGAVMYYTTNGLQPNTGSDSFINGGTVLLTSNAIIKAYTRAQSDGTGHDFDSDSSIVSASFTVVPPVPVGCGSSNSGMLSPASPSSTVFGPGFFCSRYSFTPALVDIGKVVTVTASSSDFDTFLFVKDTSTNVLAWNDDYLQDSTDSQVVFRVLTNGTYIFEVTSYSPQQTGDFTLEVDCEAVAELNVLTNAFTNGVTTVTTNSGILPVGGLIDFGQINLSTYATNYVTVTNSGNANLMISNPAVYPAAAANSGNGFSILPTGVMTLLPGGITNLAVTLYSTNLGSFDGYLIFSNNDAGMGSMGPENPYWAEVKGNVGITPGVPFVNIYFPTNGMLVASTNSLITNVVLEIDAVVLDTNGVSNVTFYANSTLLATLTNPPYTTYWTNPPVGQPTIWVKAYDRVTGNVGSNSVVINVGAPLITLGPTNVCGAGISNTTFTATATLYNNGGGLVSGASVIFSVSGAHNFYYTNTTGVNGQVSMTYTGTNAGLDTIVASATVNGLPAQSSPVTRDWAFAISCGNGYASTLTNASALSIGPVASHYADFYSIAGTAGQSVTLMMTSSNFAPFLYLMDTNCNSEPVIAQTLGTNAAQMVYTFPSNSTYVIEATSAGIFQTGPYILTANCGTPPNAPQIGALVSGTNMPDYGIFNLGVTTNNTALSKTLTITNTGSATLNITGWALYYGQTNLFSITPSPVGSLAITNGTNLTIQFLATNSGQYLEALVLTNNDPNQNPFVINLTAISIANVAPPVVNIVSPTNATQFIAPASFTISANALAIGGATITNVAFVFTTGPTTYLIGNVANPVAGSTSNYVIGASFPATGNYLLQAVAFDSHGGIAASTPVAISVAPSTLNHPPVARNDHPLVLANSANNVLNVLTNDFDPDGDALTITQIIPSTTPGPHGTAIIVNNGKAISYTPPHGYASPDTNTPADGFSYQISDGKGGTALGGVYVVVYASPVPYVVITNPWPTDGSLSILAGTVTNLMVDLHGNQNVVEVQYYDGSDMFADVFAGATTPPFSYQWTVRKDDCRCGIQAVAIDVFGQRGVSPKVSYNITVPSTVSPFAQIDSPAPVSTLVLGGAFDSQEAVVEDGLLVVTGSVYQYTNTSGANYTTNSAQYRVLIKASDDTTILRDTGWLPKALIVDGVINTNDLTTLQNDKYIVELLVRDDYETVTKEVTFILNSRLKIGPFTFSESDMVIPAGALPLTVVRSYNSQNPNLGDFGYSWTYAINDLDVKFDEQRVPQCPLDVFDEGPAYSGNDFSLRVGGSRDVTLTLPDGERTTFYYFERGGQCNPDDSSGSEVPIDLCAIPVYYTPPGVHYTLKPVDELGNDLGGYDLFLKVWQKGGGETAHDAFDFPAFLLTDNIDGTEYFIQRDYQGEFSFLPDDCNSEAVDFFGDTTDSNFYDKAYMGGHLKSIKLPSGEKIVYNTGSAAPGGGTQFSIDFLDAAGNKTRSIYFQRNSQGQISAVMDPISGSDGIPVVQYQYDFNTNLIRVLKLLDRTAGTYLTNQYFYENAQFPHYITKIVDARGYPAIRNLYDDQGHLIGTIDASGYTNRFVHDVTGRQEIQYDRLGYPTTYVYDKRGNVLQSVDPMGHLNSYSYDDNGYLLSSTDPLMHTTTYTRDGAGHPLSVTKPFPAGADPAKYTATFSYDAFGNTTAVISPGGSMVTNVYDSTGRFLSRSDESGRLIEQAAYDSSGNLTNEVDRMGVSVSLGYDSMGNLTNMGGPLDKSVPVQYDANGNVTNTGSGGGAGIAYDAQNRRTSVDAGNGMTANITIGNQPDWTHVSSPTIGDLSRTYDEQGRLASSTSVYGTTIGYQYDPDGRIAYQTNDLGQVIHYTYDPAGRMISSTNLTTGAASGYNLDAGGNLVQQSDALGNTTGFGYNPDGSIAFMTNALGYVWSYTYDTVTGCCGADNAAGTETDPLGRVKLKINSPEGLPLQMVYLSGTDAATNSLTYWSGGDDPEGSPQDFIATVTDEGGNTRNFNYTDIGQPWQASDLGGVNFWTNSYDLNGNVSSISGPTSETVSNLYDDMDNLTQVQFPDGNWLTNTYNPANNLLASTRLPSGQTVNFNFDSTGRLTNQTASTGESTSLTYDSFNRIVQTQDNNGNTTNLYDANGRLYEVDKSDGSSVHYNFDVLGRIASMSTRASATGASYTNQYTYDAVGNLTNITVRINGQTLQTTYLYDSVNRMIQRRLPNGIVTTYAYDWRDRVTSVVHSAANGTLLASVAYVRQGIGQPTRITREDGSYAMLAYDSSLRLTNEVYYNASSVPQSTNRYAYDAAGTRILFGTPGVTYTNNVQKGYQVQQIRRADNGTVSFQYSYDAGGRVVSASTSGGTLKLGYNIADQVTAVTNGSATSLFTYDASGRRVNAVDNGTSVRRFVLASGKLDLPVLIADGSGTVQQGYVYVGDAPLLRFDSTGNVTYYLEDGIGSVIGLAPGSNPSTSTTTRLFYDSFGNSRGNNGPNPTIPSGTGGDFRFQSMWQEQATLLYHTRAREYDPQCGRFYSRDSEGDFKMPESLNPYVFALNNPLVYNDPSGEFSLVELNVTTAIDFILESLGDAAASWAKTEIQATLQNVLTRMVLNQLPQFGIPMNITKILGYYQEYRAFRQGNALQMVLWEALCYVLRNAGQDWSKALHHEVWVASSPGVSLVHAIYPGDPLTPGKNCIGDNPQNLSALTVTTQWRIPDLIVGQYPPLNPVTGGANTEMLDGEIKLKASTFFKCYFIPGYNKPQMKAILQYARRHTEWHTSMFFVGLEDQPNSFVDKKVETVDEAVSLAKGVQNGVLSLYIPMFKLTSN
jgi:RHS repeat-associated protein